MSEPVVDILIKPLSSPAASVLGSVRNISLLDVLPSHSLSYINTQAKRKIKLFFLYKKKYNLKYFEKAKSFTSTEGGVTTPNQNTD